MSNGGSQGSGVEAPASASTSTDPGAPAKPPGPEAGGNPTPENSVGKPWNAEQVEAITHTVLAVLAAQEDANQEKPKSGWLVSFEFLSSHWPVIAFLLAVLGVVVASIADKEFSVLYPFNEIAFKQRELTHKHRELAHKEAEFAKAQFEKQEAERLVTFARSYLDVEQFAEAKRVYKEALALDPTNSNARTGLLKSDVYALATAKQYDPEVVSKRLEFLLAQDHSDPHAHTALGNIYASIDTEKARGHYEEAIKAPNVAGARFGLGLLLVQEERYDLAIPLLEAAKKLSPWNQRYLETLAYAHWRGGEIDTASSLYDLVLRLDPGYVSPVFEYGIALREAGKLREAAAYQQRLLTLLADETVMGQDKNKAEFWFPTEQGTSVILREVAEKRVYALYSVAATMHLLGSEDAAVSHAVEAEKTKIANAVHVKALVASDLARLARKRPALQSKLTEFTNTFLTKK